MARQNALEFRWWDLKALVFDQLLDTIGDVEVSVFVLVADVSGAEVAVFGERVAGAFGVIQVAEEDVGTFYPELADLADGDFGFGGGHVFCGLVGEEGTDGADSGLPAFPWLGKGGIRSLFDECLEGETDGLPAYV